MKKSMKKFLTVALSAAMIFSLAGCGANNDAEDNKDKEVANVFPFTLTTYQDTEVTFTKVPEKILSTNVNTGEQLMAMGLGDKIIGTCNNVSNMKEEYKVEYDKRPVIAERDPALETVIELAPDFIYGRAEVFKDKRIASHETFNTYGIPTLSSYESYKTGCTIDDVYQDFYNLGKIFQKEDRAEEIVSEMKTKIAAVQEKVKGQEAVKVFVYDMARDAGAFTPGNNFTSELIRLAGGVNVFENLEKTWNTVSWESVVEANPEVIIINDYGKTTKEEKIQQLKENPALANIDAIKNNRIITVTLPEVFASARAAETVEKIAEVCFPELFK